MTSEHERDVAEADDQIAKLIDTVQHLTLAKAALQRVGDLLYRQVLDSNEWINFGATRPGAGLCICFAQPVGDSDNPVEPATHDLVCTQFRVAVFAWKSVRDAEPGAYVLCSRCAGDCTVPVPPCAYCSAPSEMMTPQCALCADRE